MPAWHNIKQFQDYSDIDLYSNFEDVEAVIAQYIECLRGHSLLSVIGDFLVLVKSRWVALPCWSYCSRLWDKRSNRVCWLWEWLKRKSQRLRVRLLWLSRQAINMEVDELISGSGFIWFDNRGYPFWSKTKPSITSQRSPGLKCSAQEMGSFVPTSLSISDSLS